MPDRFLNLASGTAMVVSDLHGDRDAFDRCLAHFQRLYRRGEAHRLIFLGDVIHGYDSAERDGSLGMVLAILKLQERLGPETVIMLLGNHEMPHIYGVTLSKGEHDFTPRFEHSLGAHRERVLSFFESLPFMIRTAAGIMLSHAGPALDVVARAEVLRTYDHRAVLEQADRELGVSGGLANAYDQFESLYGAPYEDLARHTLAIDGPGDPRYAHLLRGLVIGQRDRQFRLLWDLLFSRNEIGLNPAAYRNGCQQFLEAFSDGAPAPQRGIVSGHIPTPGGGHAVVNMYHLRLASAAHACPREAGQYLLLDCARPVQTVEELLPGLRPVF